MTSRKAIYLIVGLILTFLVFRFVLSLFNDGPTPSKVSSTPINFPICQGSSETEAIMNIQKSLNKTKKTFFTPNLEEDGLFGSATEWELKNQTASICVTKSMYISMA